MRLINNLEPTIIDIYDVKMNDDKFNIRKFKEIISYSSIDLNREFSYKNKYTGQIESVEGPLYHPYSTLLLANTLCEKIEKYTNEDIVKFINDTLVFYDPMDLYSIYNLIINDTELANIEYMYELIDYLDMKYKDLNVFREIFEHMSFEYKGSMYVGKLRQYFIDKPRGSLLPRNMIQDYLSYENAKYNSKVLNLLKLTPNRIN